MYRCSSRHDADRLPMSRSRKTKQISRASEDPDTRPWPQYSAVPPLSITHETIAHGWHPHKNGNLTPNDFTYGSNQKVWWRCSECRQSWAARIEDRTLNKSGCPFCAGKRASPDRNLQVCYPVIAAQWHRSRNGSIKPRDILPMSEYTLLGGNVLTCASMYGKFVLPSGPLPELGAHFVLAIGHHLLIL